VDVTEVSLSDLVFEYLSYLDEMRRMDLDLTSEFLLIAATLVQLKVRRLFPDDSEIELDEELALLEERDRLLARLLTCVTFKDVAAVLAARMETSNRFVPRVSGIDQQISVSPPDVTIPISASELARIAEKVLSDEGKDLDLDHLEPDLPSVQAAIDELRVRVAETTESTFESLVDHCTRRIEVAAYFLALLELARWGMVKIHQEDWLSQIEIRYRPESAGTQLSSEWTQ